MCEASRVAKTAGKGQGRAAGEGAGGRGQGGRGQGRAKDTNGRAEQAGRAGQGSCIAFEGLPCRF